MKPYIMPSVRMRNALQHFVWAKLDNTLLCSNVETITWLDVYQPLNNELEQLILIETRKAVDKETRNVDPYPIHQL